MLEIVVDPRRTYNLKQAVLMSIENGDYDSLYDDIRDCFTDEQIAQMEELLETGDIEEAIDEIVQEWNAEDADDLFESIEGFFADADIEVQFLHDTDFEDDEDDPDSDFEDDLGDDGQEPEEDDDDFEDDEDLDEDEEEEDEEDEEDEDYR